MRGRGFTLIELLVVISIIALLSSVVLASLNAARTKGADAAVMQNLTAMRSEAALIYSDTGSFDTICSSATNSGRMYRAAYEHGTKTNNTSLCIESDASGSLNNLGSASPYAPMAERWAAVIELKGGGYFCVDYRGVAREQASRGIDFQSGSITDYDC